MSTIGRRFSVLSAILNLPQTGDPSQDGFTVEDLHKLTGVKSSTIRTIIQRERHLFDRLEPKPSGERGGQFARYRLGSNARSQLSADFDEVRKELRVASQ